MFRLCMCFVLSLVFSCYAASPAYERFLTEAEKSDFYINLSKGSEDIGLDLKIYCKNALKYSRHLSDFNNFTDYKSDNFCIYRKQDILVSHFFDEKKNLSYDLGLSFDGTIDLSCGENYTGNDVSYAIQTFGDIINNHPISFYQLYTYGNSINNSSILAIKKFYLLHYYYYNSGILDFKNDFINGISMNEYYIKLLLNFMAKNQAGYNFKKDSLDNEGVILSNGLRAGGENNSSGFNINSSGTFISENFDFRGQHNTINAEGSFIVNDTMSGNIENINIGETIMKVGRSVAGLIRSVNNKGNLIFEKDNDLKIEELNNLGQITGLGNLSLTVKALVGKGIISAKGALRLIEQAKREIAQKIDDNVNNTFQINGILLGNERSLKHIVDYYLNTITIYEDAFGHEVSRSETGYIFQRREENEKKIPISQEERDLLNEILDNTYKIIGKLNNAFNDLEQIEEAILKGMSDYEKKYGSSDSLKVNLKNLLQAQGISFQQQACMVNNFMSIPYSCNAMRLNSSIISGIDILSHYENFIDDLINLEYESKEIKKLKRKSWDSIQHIESLKGASHSFTLESLIANATLIRYEFEQWKERNPQAYEAFLKSIDIYNNSVLARSAGEALLNAIPTRGGSLLQFAAGVSLFTGVEFIASLIADHGADKIASYCAGDNELKFASYLKTCEYIINFVAERIILEYGKGKFWDGLKSGKEDQKLINLKRKAKCEIRSDGNYFYKFDPAHKTAKVHLHKYKHQGGDKYKLIAEVNPETGEVKLINGDCEIW